MDNLLKILNGDCRELLKTLPDESVHCCVTSPPYFGLRQYGTPPLIWDGDADCDHEWGEERIRHKGGPQGKTGERSDRDVSAQNAAQRISTGRFCLKCDAHCGSLGLEPTIELYISHLVGIFREVRRVLRSDGTCWINISDSYANDGKWGGRTGGKHATSLHGNGQGRKQTGLPPKSLMLIPARLILALQADGWLVRSDIIWSKNNPMPSPVNDRPLMSHEYVFLLAKSPEYFFDCEAIKEPSSPNTHSRGRGSSPKQNGTKAEGFVKSNQTFRTNLYQPETRNARTVWTIPVEKLSEPHYAAFPEELARRCILASTSERGVCTACGAQHERTLETILPSEESARPQAREAARRFKEAGITIDHIKAIRAVGITDTERARATSHGAGNNDAEIELLAAEAKAALGGYYREFLTNEKRTTGWRAGCSCEASRKRAVILDPFAGSGTTGRAAIRLGRSAILVELSSEYVGIIERRCQTTLGLFGLAEAEAI